MTVWFLMSSEELEAIVQMLPADKAQREVVLAQQLPDMREEVAECYLRQGDTVDPII